MAVALPPALAVPTGEAARVPTETSVVSATNPAPYGWVSYAVRRGDTLIAIAARYRTTPGVLASRNHISNPRALRAGASIQVPRLTAPVPAPRPTVVARTYTVRAGDTLTGIAARYRTTVPALVKANRLKDPSLIFPGQRLTVGTTTTTTTTTRARTTTTTATKAAAKTTTASVPPSTAYTVVRGDTLSAIALRHHTTVTAIAKASHIVPSSILRIGQRLTIPSPAPRPTVASTTTTTASGHEYSAAVTEAANRNRAILAGRTVPDRTHTKALVEATARRYGVDPKLALAISYVESGWNQRAVSPANAVGVMQVIPAAGQWASDLVGRRLDLLDADDNITAGVAMLRALSRNTTSTDEAIAAYYQGLTSVTTHGMYSSTKHYVALVTAWRARM